MITERSHKLVSVKEETYTTATKTEHIKLLDKHMKIITYLFLAIAISIVNGEFLLESRI